MKESMSDPKAPSQPSVPPKLYNEAICAELQELKSETELLFRKLQSLSRQRMAQSGMAQ